MVNVEFNKKLQQLRKAKGLTQEELAQALFVSRTAVSKWESGRGYPSIDSLKAIADYFSVTVDALLSGEQVLCLAEQDCRRRESRMEDLVFGLLDCSVVLLFFLPFFGQQTGGGLLAVSLLSFMGTAPWLRAVYLAAVSGIVVTGLLTLALQNWEVRLWLTGKRLLSLGLHGAGILVFILTRQPYPGALLFLFLAIKVLLLLKRR